MQLVTSAREIGMESQGKEGGNSICDPANCFRQFQEGERKEGRQVEGHR